MGRPMSCGLVRVTLQLISLLCNAFYRANVVMRHVNVQDVQARVSGRPAPCER